ncbi:MAG: zf-HC2 domain-containing protein [Candidatus Sulfotelmatobacter sp.]
MVVNPKMLNCEEVWREISNYVDGDVGTALRASMDEHFQACKRCASILAGTRNVVQLYGDELMLEVPAGFSRRMEKRLAKSAATGRGWSSLAAWLIPVAAIALFTGSLALVDQLTFKNPAKSILAVPANNIPPDMLVVVSDGSKVFHVAGCPFIHDKATERTITAKQAMQDGYVPCSRCLRQYLKTGLTKQPGADEDNEADEGQEVLSTAAH